MRRRALKAALAAGGVALFMVATRLSASTLTWNGANPGNWHSATNWTPAQVPTAADTAIINSGSVTNTGSAVFSLLVVTNSARVSGPLVVSSGARFSFGGGRIDGWVQVENGGLLESVGGNYYHYLNGGVTNAGTIRQSGSGPVVSPVVNLPGALWEILDDSIVNLIDGNVVFQNHGTLRKSGGAGSCAFYPSLLNSGQVEILSGALYLVGGATMDGAWTAAAGASVQLGGGDFTYSPPVNWSGDFRFVDGRLTLDRVIPNLQLLGGTLHLAPSFQGGAITNLTMNGGTLTSSLPITGTLRLDGNAVVNTTNTVSGLLVVTNSARVSGPLVVAAGARFIFGGGRIDGWVRVENGGLLESVGGNYYHYLNGGVTNAGTIRQSGSGPLVSPVVNLPGALWEILDDSIVNSIDGNVSFQNHGTLRKSGGAGSCAFYPRLLNNGLVEVLSGNLNLSSGAQMDAGLLQFGFSNINAFGTVLASTPISLGGSIGAVFLNGFVPPVGTNFVVMTFPSRTNTFNNSSAPFYVSSGRGFQPLLTATNLQFFTISTNYGPPPTITTQPQSQTTFAGTTASFCVTATGTAPLAYQWRSNSVPLAGATNACYSITNVQTSHAAGYSVVVTNVAGSVTSQVAVLTVSDPAAGVPLPSGCVAWWRGESNAMDSVGTNHGAVFGGLQYTNGIVGSGFWFNGSDSGIRILASTAVNVGTSGGMTFEVWMKPLNLARAQTFFAYAPGGAWNYTEGLIAYHTPFTVWLSTSQGRVEVGSSTNLMLNQFQHLAVTYDNASGVARLYLNGSLVGDLVVGTNATINTAGDFYLGYEPGYQFSGVLDEPALYSRALSGNEIAAIYQAGSAGKVMPTTALAFSTALPASGLGGGYSYGWQFTATQAITLTALGMWDSGSDGLSVAYPVLVWDMASNVVCQGTVSTNGRLASGFRYTDTLAGNPTLAPGTYIIGAKAVVGTDGWAYDYPRGSTTIAPPLNSIASVQEFSIGSGLLTNNYLGAHDMGFFGPNFQFTSAPVVGVAPSITAQPLSQTNLAGSAASFCVTGTGTAPLTYQWRSNSVPLVGATDACYSITNVQAFHAAGYSVVVTNLAGSVTSQVATLTVWVPPTITDQPQSQTNVAGTTAAFSVTATGTAPLSYQWRSNGVVLAGATNTIYSIANVQTSHAASYTVVVTNAAGSVTSVVATLTVLGPPAITAQPQSRTNLAGTTATFNVGTTGTAPLSYQWRSNSVALAGATNSSYSIANVQPLHAASYSVVVTNAAGSVTSQVASLTVWVPVSITAQPQSQTNIAGATATFCVTATGTTPIGYQWRSNGVALAAATNSCYVIANVQPIHAASYDVVASNVAGSLTSQVAMLTVWVKPTITAQPQDRTNVVGSPATFSVTASGTAPLSYEWRSNGVVIAAATNSGYSIASVQASHAAGYSVVVTNLAGSITSQVANLTVWAPPSITSQPQARTNVVGTTAIFSVAASGTMPLSYQWRSNGLALAGATTSVYTIDSVQPAHAAGYSVVVTNVAGSITSSVALLTVSNLPAGGSWVIRQLPASYQPQTAFTVTVAATPASNIVAYAVQERSPTNWPVTGISDGGEFDAMTKQVKWGPFFDATARNLTYTLTPPADATNEVFFSGLGSADGVDAIIGGQTNLLPLLHHPADSDRNLSLRIGEMTAYAAAWKLGQSWPVLPSPIPIAYVTRAGTLWRSGEAYRFSPQAGAAPLCWVPAAGGAPNGVGGSRKDGNCPATRSIAQGTNIAIRVQPGAGVLAYAVEESLPRGFTAAAISDAGVFDPNSGRVRWGPFFDPQPRVLAFQLQSTAGATGTFYFSGVASFDGVDVFVSGTDQVTFGGLVPAPVMAAELEAGVFKLRLYGPVGRRVLVEQTDSLATPWQIRAMLELSEETGEILEPQFLQNSHRFYRATVISCE